MANSSLLKKLQIKSGQRIAIINPPQGYLDELGPLPERTKLAKRVTGTFDLVHLFVKNVAELNKLAPKAIRAVRPDGILWISYPKASSQVETDITRDAGWDVVRQAGLRPVTQIAINEVWSALRFRPIEQVGKTKR